MFDWLKFKTSPKAALPLYLGDVAVTPNDLQTDWLGWGVDETYLKIKQWVVESLGLAFESDIQECESDYYILDIIVSYDIKNLTGVVGSLLFQKGVYRPKIELHARLYKKSDTGTLQNFTTVKAASKKEVIDRSFSISGLLGRGAIVKQEEFERMTVLALVDLVEWLKIHVDKK